MATEILLEKQRDIKSVNVPNSMDVELKRHYRPIPNTHISETIDKFKVYNDERDNCTDIRLIYTINPVCTNVLFNMKTEVVKDEGSDHCIAWIDDTITADTKSLSATTTTNDRLSDTQINTTISTLKREHLIRDTEYSHKNCGQLVYHCGADIFNNHMLRATEYVAIGRATGDTNDFNTIMDTRRDEQGVEQSEILYKTIGDGKTENTTETRIHVYQLDNIMTFQEAYAKNLVEVNGWYGFINKANIDIPNAKDGVTVINKIMNNNKACEIYNLYPDISLFSFIPKVNKFRHRLEPNWDYCLTYPYKSDYEKFAVIMGYLGDDDFSGIRIAQYVTGKTNTGEEAVYMRALIKHNLSTGDYVRFYFNSGDKKASRRTKVSGLGDINGNDKEHWFVVYTRDVQANKTPNQNTFFKKEVNGEECQYYVRRFKKLKKYDGSDYTSEIGKLAFGENVYGDRLAQIVFTDTISLTSNSGQTLLCDNLNRPVSEVYLTIVKRNKGHEQWYGIDGATRNFSSSAVEFSHCFDKISSGIDIGELSRDNNISTYNLGRNNYNIRKLGSADFNNPTPLESNITINGGKNGNNSNDWLKDEFYGDIVEFDPNLYQETVLEKVYHRFNTVQRERGIGGNNIYWDDIKKDDYELNKVDSFSAATETIANVVTQPEGYFYSPHHKTKLFDISNVKTYLGTLIRTTTAITSESKTETGYQYTLVKATAVTDYDYVPGDSFALYSYDKKKTYWGFLENVKREGDVCKLEIVFQATVPTGNLSNYDLVLTDGSVPQYAVYLPIQESFTWRDVVPPSETKTDSDVYTTPFSNGCLYYHTNVNFFCRRQDPFNEYGLFDFAEYNAKKNKSTTIPKVSFLKIRGEKFVNSKVDYISEIIDSCL